MEGRLGAGDDGRVEGGVKLEGDLLDGIIRAPRVALGFDERRPLVFVGPLLLLALLLLLLVHQAMTVSVHQYAWTGRG